MTTETCRLWREYQDLLDKKHKALEASAVREFPVGTHVRWTYTFDRDQKPVKRTGTVVSVMGSDLSVQIKANGPKHRVQAFLAEIIKDGVPA